MLESRNMQRFTLLLLDVWREACRHIEIAEATLRIAPLLRTHMPVDLVLVRRIDVQRSCIETVGMGAPPDAAQPEATRSTCTPD